MIKILPNGVMNFEGIECAIVQEPIKNGLVGRLTLTMPLEKRNPEEVIKFFEDPLSILELEIVFNCVIISKRVWVAYDFKADNSELIEGEVPVVIADYECRSMDRFAESVKSKTVVNVHIVDSNDCLENGSYQGKYTADIFMTTPNNQIPSFTNSSFESNISMIFLDQAGDMPSFVIRQVIPFIESKINESVVPKEYHLVYDHHVLCIGRSSETISIISTPVGFKVDGEVYSVTECLPTSIVYNPEIWKNKKAASVFRTLVRTTFANGDIMHYPIHDKEYPDRFMMRRVSKTTVKSIYGDRMGNYIPECVALRLIREPYLNMKIDSSFGIFDYRFESNLEILQGLRLLHFDVFRAYAMDFENLETRNDLSLPAVIVKIDRDSYDKFCDSLPVNLYPEMADAMQWVVKKIGEKHIQNTGTSEVLVNNIRDVIIGYW